MVPVGERGAGSGSGCGPREEPRKGELGVPKGVGGQLFASLGKVTGMELLPSHGWSPHRFPAWVWWQRWIRDGGASG